MDRKRNKIAKQVKSQINDVANRLQRNFNSILIEFGLERLLYRLSNSRFSQRFVLKGGMLMSLWSSDLGRISHDIDLLAFTENDGEDLKRIFSEIVSIDLSDGLHFDADGITYSNIMLNEEYHGIRLKIPLILEKTEVKVSVDIGFGDALPHPGFEIDYPSILSFESARVRAYSRETVIAEKFHTVIKFGNVNTRMKDFYDLWVLLNDPDTRRNELRIAVNSVFETRGTIVPTNPPFGLTQEFATMPDKVHSWTNYTKRTKLSSKPLTEVVTDIWLELKTVLSE